MPGSRHSQTTGDGREQVSGSVSEIGPWGRLGVTPRGRFLACPPLGAPGHERPVTDGRIRAAPCQWRRAQPSMSSALAGLTRQRPQGSNWGWPQCPTHSRVSSKPDGARVAASWAFAQRPRFPVSAFATPILMTRRWEVGMEGSCHSDGGLYAQRT